MTSKRSKRLPTDFFDRLLSNQNDDQINDLLSTLVEEQITPTQTAQPEAVENEIELASVAQLSREVSREGSLLAELPLQDAAIEDPSGPPPLSDVKDHAQPMLANETDLLQNQSASSETEWETPVPEIDSDSDAAAPTKPIAAAEHSPVEGIDLAWEQWMQQATAESQAVGEEITRSVAEVSVPAEMKPMAAVEEAAARLAAEQASGSDRRHGLKWGRARARWGKKPHIPKKPRMAQFTPSSGMQKISHSTLDDYIERRQAKPFMGGRIPYARAALFFLLPAFIAFSLLSWYPMIKGFWLSLHQVSISGASQFVGLENYARAFHDLLFWRSLLNGAGFCLLILVFGFFPPLFMAIFINELRSLRGFLKFLFFLPFLMPLVPAAILWKWMLNQGYGLVNTVLSLFSSNFLAIGWLTDPRLALFSIVALYLWKNTGWGILIYSAGLASVNETLYEEMEINGASLWDKLRMVTLPSLQGVIWVMLVISVINTLQVFTEVYIMTQGGPRHATEMMTTYIYKQAFFNMDLGYASALSVILLVLILGVTLLRLQRMHSNPEAV